MILTGLSVQAARPRIAQALPLITLSKILLVTTSTSKHLASQTTARLDWKALCTIKLAMHVICPLPTACTGQELAHWKSHWSQVEIPMCYGRGLAIKAPTGMLQASPSLNNPRHSGLSSMPPMDLDSMATLPLMTLFLNHVTQILFLGHAIGMRSHVTIAAVCPTPWSVTFQTIVGITVMKQHAVCISAVTLRRICVGM